MLAGAVALADIFHCGGFLLVPVNVCFVSVRLFRCAAARFMCLVKVSLASRLH